MGLSTLAPALYPDENQSNNSRIVSCYWQDGEHIHSASRHSLLITYLFYVNVAVLGFTIVAGTIGNCLVFLSMFFEVRLVTCVNGLHGNLAMTDALNCMLGASIHFVRLFLDPETLAFSIITSAEEFLLYYNISASCLSTMALSFLKYWKLTHPLNKQPCKVIYLTMFIIQITAILIGVTSLFERSGLLGSCHKLLPTLNYSMWSILFILIPLFLFSIVFSATLKIASLITLRREVVTIKKMMMRIHSQQSAAQNDFTGARGAFFAMTAVQCVCYLPFVAAYIWKSGNNLHNVVAESIVTCLMCSCAINPFLYTLRCHTYRRTLRRKIFGCGAPDSSLDGTVVDETQETSSRPKIELPDSEMLDLPELSLPVAKTDKTGKLDTVDESVLVQVRISTTSVQAPPAKPPKPQNAFVKNCPCNTFNEDSCGGVDLKF